MAKKTFRKPSQIKAESDDQVAKAKPFLDRIDELKTEKAEQVNYYGGLIDRVRKSGKLNDLQLSDWRDGIYAMPEDDRPAAIEAKVTELGL